MGKYERETVWGMVKNIFVEPRFAQLKFMIGVTTALSFITIFYNSIFFSCQLILLQNLISVYLSILVLFVTVRMVDRSKRIKLGVAIAAILGAFYAAITLLIDNVQYYFFGFREQAFLAKGLIAPPTTFVTLQIELGSQIYLFLILVLISAFAGFLAAITRQKRIHSD